MGRNKIEGTSPDRLVSPRVFREISGCPRDLLYQMLATGKLPAIQRGRSYLIPLQPALQKLQALAESQEEIS